MARISTGQNYGDVDRQTAQQLLGGAAVDAVTGGLAQRQINTPSLQPAAAPVNTFQQTGAPTLGGAPRMFAPPDLPQPSQDLANLAKALGGFSTVLGEFSTSYLQYEKNRGEQMKTTGATAGARFAMENPGADLIAYRDALEKKAMAGDQDARARLQVFRAMSPLELTYADKYVQKLNTQSGINSALQRWQDTVQIPDGRGGMVDRDQLDPNNPDDQRLIRGAMAGMIPMPRDPMVWAELQPQIQDIYRQLSKDQYDRVAARKERVSNAAVMDGMVAALEPRTGPDGQVTVDVAKGAGDITALLNNARMFLGIERYQKLVDNIPQYIRSSALRNAIGADGKVDIARFNYNVQAAQEMFTKIQAGPNGELLLERLGSKGGALGQLELTTGLMEDLKKLKGSLDYGAEATGQFQADRIIAAAGLDNPAILGNELERDQRLAQASAAAYRIQDPVQRQAALDRIQKAANEGKYAIGEPAQRAAEREAFFRQGNLLADPEQEIAWLNQKVASGLMSASAAKGWLSQWTALRKEELAPIKQAAQKEITAILESYTNSKGSGVFDLPGSRGGQTLTAEERADLLNVRAGLGAQVNEVIRKSVAAGEPAAITQQRVVEFLTDPKMRPKPAQAPASSQAMFPGGVDQWRQSLGWFGAFGRGNAADNERLRMGVRNGTVFDKQTYMKYANEWGDNGVMSPDLRLMIERAGFKQNPSEFFRLQFQRLFPDSEFPLEKFQKRDLEFRRGQDADLTGRMMPLGMIDPARYGRTSMALGAMVRNMAASAMDVVVPSAQAAEPVMATASRAAISVSPGQRQSVITAARQLGIRPVDLAAVISLETGGTFAKDIRGGDGNRYRGLIQFGPTEQRTYGYRQGMSFEEQVLGPVVRYLKARGVRPGHTAKEVYAAILTGNVANIKDGGLDWKDSNGTSVRKALPSLTNGGHYQNAIRFLRGG